MLEMGQYQKPGILPTLQDSADIEYQLLKIFQIPDTKVLLFLIVEEMVVPIFAFFLLSGTCLYPITLLFLKHLVCFTK